MRADQVGAEGAGRVHGGARDGAAPQAGQGDVAADPEGTEDADVLGPEAVPRITLTRPMVKISSIQKAAMLE